MLIIKKLYLNIEETLGRVARIENSISFLYDNLELQLQGHSLADLLKSLNEQRESRKHWTSYSKKNPKISVIIPVSRSIEVVTSAIDSVAAQTYSNIELILVTESENKDLSSNIKKRRDKRILLITNSSKSKVSGEWANWSVSGGSSRNIGLQSMSGDFFTFLDDDDFMLPQKIEKCLNFAKSNNLEFVGHLEGFEKNGKIELLRGNKINKTRKFHSGSVDYLGLNTNTIFMHKFYSRIKWPIYNYKNMRGNDPVYLRLIFALNPIYALLPEILVLNDFSNLKK